MFHRVGNNYHSFLKKNLKKYYYITDQDGFNMSCCKLDNDRELYCIRFLGLVPAYFGDEVIPGNYSIFSKKYIEKKLGDRKLKIGKNFFWNSWTETLLDNTIFFVGSYNNSTINVDLSIKPFIISNKAAFTTINEGSLKYNDVRLININGSYFCYDSLITSIYQIKIVDNKISIPLNLDDDVYSKELFYFKNKLCNKCENDKCYYKKFDKNWSFVDTTKEHFEFINWFENGYVTNTLISKKNGLCYKNNIIEMKGYKIDGLGTDEMPMFSLGSPFIKLETTNDEIFNGVSAGHLKLISTKYYNNVNLSMFFEKLKKYKNIDNYIEHNSYIYMCYYIHMIKYKDGSYKMFISDGYLYIDQKEKYLFSICFPMGGFEKNNKISFSYGYGDFYNYMIDFEKKELLSLIKHDISNIDINKYHFHLID
jgi:hypothetical protein